MSKPIWSWRQAIEESDIKAPTKALAFVIANDLTDTGKFSQMPIEDLARRAGMNVRSAETHIGKLKTAKLLNVTIRRDALGHPIGRKFAPTFPASFSLATETQSANVAVRDETQTAKNNSQNASFDGQTANLAVIYKETSSQTSSQTFQEPPTPLQGESAAGAPLVELAPKAQELDTRARNRKSKTNAQYTLKFEEAWKAFPERQCMSKPKAFASWQDQACEQAADAVIAGVAAYAAWLAKERKRRPDHPVKHMQGWLTDRRWESFEEVQAGFGKTAADDDFKFRLDLAASFLKDRKWLNPHADIWRTADKLMAWIRDHAPQLLQTSPISAAA